MSQSLLPKSHWHGLCMCDVQMLRRSMGTAWQFAVGCVPFYIVLVCYYILQGLLTLLEGDLLLLYALS